MKCEYCNDGYKSINIGELLGKGEKWGCNKCAEKMGWNGGMIKNELIAKNNKSNIG